MKGNSISVWNRLFDDVYSHNVGVTIRRLHRVQSSNCKRNNIAKSYNLNKKSKSINGVRALHMLERMIELLK